jgi:hypothetical protein
VITCPIYVDAAAPDGGNGTAWDAAFNNLKNAITAAKLSTQVNTGNSCQVWVAQGTYTPNANSYFDWVDYIDLYGGFSGSETSLSQRDWRAHPTILNGNGSHVVRGYGVFHAALDGFTIQNGNATSGSGENQEGGGIFLDCSGPLLTNLIISGNSATLGGGIFSGNISTCAFTNHTRLVNVVVTGNSATQGGGMYAYLRYFTLSNATVSGNSAGEGAGIYFYQGGSQIFNSIVWEGSVHTIDRLSANTSMEVDHSLVRGCNPGGIWNTASCGALQSSASNPPDDDPALSSSLHQLPGSPVIDAGSPAYVLGMDFDLDHRPRVNGGAPDIGAYELHVPPSVSSFEKSCLMGGKITFTAEDFTGHFANTHPEALSQVRIKSLPERGKLYLSQTEVTADQAMSPAVLPLLNFRCPIDWHGALTFQWNAADSTDYAASPAAVTLNVLQPIYLPLVIGDPSQPND